MLSLVLNLFLCTFALVLTGGFLPGFEIRDVLAVFISVLVVGFMNFLIRPILLMLRVPLNFLTVGITTFVMNALLLNVATGLIDGFDIRSWEAAIVCALILSVIQGTIDAIEPDKRKLIR
jgi:putative membrane protein